jgi:hypothetical protein
MWLYDGWQLADACTVDKRCRKAYIFVDSKQRLDLQGALFLVVGVERSNKRPPSSCSSSAIRRLMVDVGIFRR